MHLKMKFFAGTALLAASIASPALADALTANGQFTTDYVLRGISQTATRPAVQGGLDYDTGIGITLGTWVSSLDFGDHTPMEWDIYGAYNFPIGPVNASVGGIGYVYPYSGNGGPYDYFEFTGTLGYDFGVAAWSAKAYYDPFDLPDGFFDIKGVHAKHEYWLTTGLSVPVVPWLAASGNIGYEGYTGAGTTDYFEWDLGVTLTYDKYALDLRYIDTNKHLSSGPYFATGPFYVATFTFKFP
ncbi:MAG TPA: TorF family putative porin [Micropepsaceae bacterium]|nr:TorF family putative porin [Micropepsaceae bacterium]